MKLTDEIKKEIDGMSYEDILYRIRFSPAGDPLFQGETWEYIGERARILIAQGADHAAASKKVGYPKA